MAQIIKVLGQSSPPATTLTDIYTVPLNYSAVVSSILICNTGVLEESFRISIAVAGAADNISQYIYYDLSISANNTFSATLGISLSQTDVIRIYSSNSTLNFHIFGIEII